MRAALFSHFKQIYFDILSSLIQEPFIQDHMCLHYHVSILDIKKQA